MVPNHQPVVIELGMYYLYIGFQGDFMMDLQRKTQEGDFSQQNPQSWSILVLKFNHLLLGVHTLWWTNKKLLKMAIEIVDCPIKNGDFPLLC